MEVQVLNQFELPAKSGNYVRLVGLQGIVEGKAFFFKDRITIGRGRNCAIVLADKRSSREHAEISIIGKQVILTDLKSQNGVFVNEIKIKQHPLKDNDKILIGSNVFKFNLVHIDSDEEIELKVAANKPPESKKKSILPILLILVGVFFLLSDDSENTGDGKKTLPQNDFFNREINTKNNNLNVEQQKKLDIIFQRGRREFREGNYFRAIAEFNLALVISPKDAAASFYLKRSKDALDKEIQSMFFKGLRDFESLKYSSAINSYCAIIRLLNKYPEDDRYKRAKKKIEEIEEKLGKEKDEIKCL